MRLASIGALAILATSAHAQDIDCSDSTNLPQQHMNYCASLDYERADKALNIAWPKVVEYMKGVDAFARDSFPEQANGHENLLKAQRAWIDYRDGHCEGEGAKYAGGSLRPLIVATCKTDLTEKRTEELLLLMEEF